MVVVIVEGEIKMELRKSDFRKWLSNKPEGFIFNIQAHYVTETCPIGCYLNNVFFKEGKWAVAQDHVSLNDKEIRNKLPKWVNDIIYYFDAHNHTATREKLLEVLK